MSGLKAENIWSKQLLCRSTEQETREAKSVFKKQQWQKDEAVSFKSCLSSEQHHTVNCFTFTLWRNMFVTYPLAVLGYSEDESDYLIFMKTPGNRTSRGNRRIHADCMESHYCSTLCNMQTSSALHKLHLRTVNLSRSRPLRAVCLTRDPHKQQMRWIHRIHLVW